MPKVNTENILGKPPGTRTVDQDYELGKVLGKGAFGTVRTATSKASGEKFACKSIAKSKLVCREDVQDVQREVAIMNHVAGHPNVVNSKVCYPFAVVAALFRISQDARHSAAVRARCARCGHAHVHYVCNAIMVGVRGGGMLGVIQRELFHRVPQLRLCARELSVLCPDAQWRVKCIMNRSLCRSSAGRAPQR
jgi:hypothetical protein